MKKFDEAWHCQDVVDEVREYEEAEGILHKWSELSDVVYTVTRAHWTGHRAVVFPFSRLAYVIGWVYMIPKYSLRWLFFRRIGKMVDVTAHVCAVRNPKKLHKLREIAQEHGIDPDVFACEAEKRVHRWFFLK